MSKDSYFQDVALLLPFDGVNGSTAIVDVSASARSLIVGGDAAIDTSKSVFGSASLHTTSGYIKSASTSPDFILHGDFTLEGWVYFASTWGDHPTICSVGLYTDGILLRDDFYINGSNLCTGVMRANAVPDTWNHIALVRASGVVTLYINGVAKYTGSLSSVINSTGNTVMLGASLHSNGAENWIGWLDEFRFTNGYARYTANFTVPTTAFPTTGLSISVTLEESITADNFIARAYKVSDGSEVGTLEIQKGVTNFSPATLEPVYIMVSPKQGIVWNPATVYALNDLVFPTNAEITPYYFKRISAGTSGTTEPTWTTSAGMQCNDGSITNAWECVAGLTQPIVQGPLIPNLMYIPSSIFSFSAKSYTPTADFAFINDIQNTVTATITLDDVIAIANAVNTPPTNVVNFTFTAENYTPSAVFVFGNISALPTIATANITLDDAQAIAVVVNLPPPAIAAANVTLDDVSAVANVFNPVTAVAAVTLDDISAVAHGWVIDNVAAASVTLDDATALSTGMYIVNVMRGATVQAVCPNTNGQSIAVDTLSTMTTVKTLDCDVLISAADTHAVIVETASSSGAINALSIDNQVNQQNAVTIFNDVHSTTGAVQFITQAIESVENEAIFISNDVQSIQPVLDHVTSMTLVEQIDCSQRHYRMLKEIIGVSANPYRPNTQFNFTTPTAPSGNFIFPVVPVIELCDSDNAGVFFKDINCPSSQPKLLTQELSVILQTAKTPAFGKSPHVDLPRPPPAPSVLSAASGGIVITIPTRETYTMQHDIAVKILPSNTPIELDKISLSYDVDMYAWNFTGVLANKADLALFNMASFDPIQLSITIDGYIWIVLVEKVPGKKSFSKTDISLTGRSLSALLGNPWILPASFTAGSDMTIQQLANALLPMDWIIDWQYPTWIIPAGTYGYTQQTKIQALKALANNIGAILKPARDSQTLTVLPRYPVLPWNYHATGINPDLVIPDSAIESIGVESRMQSPINGVYVHGGDNGVLAFCRLNGTAGDVLAPTENNVLITDQQGARMLGERILAGRATQPVITSVTTFLGGDFPLAEVGQLLAANNERAIINGVSVDVDFGEVRQTITVGEQTSNVYSKFMSLIPQYPLLVGSLVSTSGDTSVLTLLDGGVITARGTGTVGNNYYVRNGFIETAAPNLTQVDIVI